MNKAATIAWLGKWNALYDTVYDNEVSKYRGRRSLGLDELEVIYGWKYRGLWPAKKVRALREHVTDRQARDWTRRALACPDDLGALCIAGLLAGAGPGGASAVLTAADPIRFTVMDTRAIKSLAFLGKWSIDAQGSVASYRHWLDYLDQCRGLAMLSGMDLREVDRALYEAAGKP